jgi:DNA-binding NarL/FixJ family response regulator
MQQSGDWEHAACECLRATEPEHRGVEPQAVAEAYYQHAEILRLRGEIAQAEDAYRNASQMGRDPQPGLSLLRLQQARVDAAAQTIRRVMSQTALPLLRARYLPAYCEIMLAAGALAEAEQGADELDQIAARSSSEILSAMAAQVRGAHLLAKGELQPALVQLRAALDVWQRVAAPYIAARVRVLLARGYQAVGDEDGALLELDAARQVFTKLGAAPDLTQLKAATTPTPAKAPHNLSPRELEVLRHVASGKTNKLIARALGLSEKTVDRHVSNILTKIDAPSRAAATAFAYQHGLVSPATSD